MRRMARRKRRRRRRKRTSKNLKRDHGYCHWPNCTAIGADLEQNSMFIRSIHQQCGVSLGLSAVMCHLRKCRSEKIEIWQTLLILTALDLVLNHNAKEGNLSLPKNFGWHLIRWTVGEGTCPGATQSLVQVHASTQLSARFGHSSK